MGQSIFISRDFVRAKIPTASSLTSDDALLKPTQLRQTAHAPVAGIARVGPAAEVVAHLVPVVGPHRDAHPAPLLHLKQRLHHSVHVHIALKQVGLVEIALSIALGRAQMHEAHPVAELPHHRHAVVVGPHPERTCAEAESV